MHGELPTVASATATDERVHQCGVAERAAVCTAQGGYSSTRSVRRGR